MRPLLAFLNGITLLSQPAGQDFFQQELVRAEPGSHVYCCGVKHHFCAFRNWKTAVCIVRKASHHGFTDKELFDGRSFSPRWFMRGRAACDQADRHNDQCQVLHNRARSNGALHHQIFDPTTLTHGLPGSCNKMLHSLSMTLTGTPLAFASKLAGKFDIAVLMAVR